MAARRGARRGGYNAVLTYERARFFEGRARLHQNVARASILPPAGDGQGWVVVVTTRDNIELASDKPGYVRTFLHLIETPADRDVWR